jgi:hypothetical protein
VYFLVAGEIIRSPMGVANTMKKMRPLVLLLCLLPLAWPLENGFAIPAMG